MKVLIIFLFVIAFAYIECRPQHLLGFTRKEKSKLEKDSADDVKNGKDSDKSSDKDSHEGSNKESDKETDKEEETNSKTSAKSPAKSSRRKKQVEKLEEEEGETLKEKLKGHITKADCMKLYEETDKYCDPLYLKLDKDCDCRYVKALNDYTKRWDSYHSKCGSKYDKKCRTELRALENWFNGLYDSIDGHCDAEYDALDKYCDVEYNKVDQCEKGQKV